MDRRYQQKTAVLYGQSVKRIKQLAMVSSLAILLGGCLHDRGVKSNGYLIGANPKERHTIMVSKKNITMKLPVSRGDFALGDERAYLLRRFLADYRSNGSGKLRVKAPTGTPNELAAFNVMGGVRSIIAREGIPSHVVEFMPYTPNGDPEAPIRLSFLGYSAQAPECGDWSEDLTDHKNNLAYKNFGCATQANFAAMVANPRDLIEPRGMQPSSSERRDVRWDKYVKGEDTTSRESQKQKETKVKEE